MTGLAVRCGSSAKQSAVSEPQPSQCRHRMCIQPHRLYWQQQQQQQQKQQQQQQQQQQWLRQHAQQQAAMPAGNHHVGGRDAHLHRLLVLGAARLLAARAQEHLQSARQRGVGRDQVGCCSSSRRVVPDTIAVALNMEPATAASASVGDRLHERPAKKPAAVQRAHLAETALA